MKIVSLMSQNVILICYIIRKILFIFYTILFLRHQVSLPHFEFQVQNNSDAPTIRRTTPDHDQSNSSLNSSFGTDIDMNEDFLLALEKVEADYQDENGNGHQTKIDENGESRKLGQSLEKQTCNVVSKTDFHQEARKQILQASVSQPITTNMEGEPVFSTNQMKTNLRTQKLTNNHPPEISNSNFASINQSDNGHQLEPCRTKSTPNSVASLSLELQCPSKNSLKCVRNKVQVTSNSLPTNSIPNTTGNSIFCKSHRTKCTNTTISGNKAAVQSHQSTISNEGRSFVCEAQTSWTSSLMTKQSLQVADGAKFGQSPPPVTRTRKLVVEVSPPEKNADDSQVLCEDSQSPVGQDGEIGMSKKG